MTARHTCISCGLRRSSVHMYLRRGQWYCQACVQAVCQACQSPEPEGADDWPMRQELRMDSHRILFARWLVAHGRISG